MVSVKKKRVEGGRAMYLPTFTENLGKEEVRTEPISHHFIKNRAIMLFEEITDETAQSVISQLAYLDEKDQTDIFLFINSPGGSVNAGMAIYDFIKYGIKSDVNTIATGVAASMGAFLLACGTPGKRYATETAEIMIHQPLGGVQGQATDISIVAEHIQKVKNTIASILAKECDREVTGVLEDMERDNWLNAEEAKRYGLIDVVGYPDWI